MKKIKKVFSKKKHFPTINKTKTVQNYWCANQEEGSGRALNHVYKIEVMEDIKLKEEKY
jgi:hypothetical protein